MTDDKFENRAFPVIITDADGNKYNLSDLSERERVEIRLEIQSRQRYGPFGPPLILTNRPPWSKGFFDDYLGHPNTGPYYPTWAPRENRQETHMIVKNDPNAIDRESLRGMLPPEFTDTMLDALVVAFNKVVTPEMTEAEMLEAIKTLFESPEMAPMKEKLEEDTRRFQAAVNSRIDAVITDEARAFMLERIHEGMPDNPTPDQISIKVNELCKDPEFVAGIEARGTTFEALNKAFGWRVS